MPLRTPFIQWLLLPTLAILLTACSSTRTAYRYADWGIVWWVEDYINLSDAQKRQLNQSIDEYRQWHCRVELPRYIDWLTQFEADIADQPPSRETVAIRQAELLHALDRLLTEVTPMATTLLASLSDEQVAGLARTMVANHAAKEQEYLNPDPAQERQAREERSLERAEDWLGPLNDTQKDTITRWNSARTDQTRIWLDGRARWQQALLEALDDRKQASFGPQMATLIQNSAEVRGRAYQAMLNDSRPALTNLVSDLLSQADERQRANLQNELGDLRRDFDALSCQTGKPSADA